MGVLRGMASLPVQNNKDFIAIVDNGPKIM